MATAFIKISLLFQYLRFYNTPGTMRWICISTLVFLGLFATAFSFIAWFPCFPVETYWNASELETASSCYGFGSHDVGEVYSTFKAHTVMNMTLDLIVLAIPAVLWWHKDATAQTRKGLLALLAMGVW